MALHKVEVQILLVKMRVAFNFSDLVREYSHRDLLLGLLLVKLLPKGTCLYLELRAVLRGMSL